MNNKGNNIVTLERNKKYDLIIIILIIIIIIIIIIIVIIIESVRHITAEGEIVAQIQCKNWRHDKVA